MDFIRMIEENRALNAIYETALVLNDKDLRPGVLEVIGQTLINELKNEYQDKKKIEYLSNEILLTLKGGN